MPLTSNAATGGLDVACRPPCSRDIEGRSPSQALWFDAHSTLPLALRLQDAQQLGALTPHESRELQKPGARHPGAGIGFDLFTQIGAAPRSQAMAGGPVPNRAQGPAQDRNPIQGPSEPMPRAG